MLESFEYPSATLLGACYGALQRDPVSEDKYGDNTPCDFEECFAKIDAGLWHPIVTTLYGNPMQLTWLHDMVPYHQASFFGAYLFEQARLKPGMTASQRAAQAHQKRAIWGATREAITRLNCHHLFCATLLSNEPSHRWVSQTFQFHFVGIHNSFMHHQGQVVPVRVYMEHPDDLELCVKLVRVREVEHDPCFPRSSIPHSESGKQDC